MGNWDKLSQDQQIRSVQHLCKTLSPEFLGDIVEDYAKNPETWWAPYHFGSGMAIRNLLRKVIKDKDLPGVDYDGHEMRNWDDYYVEVLERAAGVNHKTKEPNG